MIITIDIGNINSQIGCFKNDSLIFKTLVSSDRNKTEIEYYLLLRDIIEMNNVDINLIEGGILSSVVPSLKSVVKNALEKLINAPVMIVGSGLKTGLNIHIESPNEMGSDLVVSAVSALSKYKKPIVVFDMETVTTMSVIDNKGVLVGGAIMPGLQVSMNAMSAHAAQLPYITIVEPKKLVNSNTVSCMQSGVVYGCAAMIDGLADRVGDELGEKPTVVLSGRHSKLIAKYCKYEIELDEMLQLDGLRLIYEKNRKTFNYNKKLEP